MIILTIIVFTIVIVLLVSSLLIAKAKLTSSGEIELNINGEKTIKTEAGSTLLSTLANQKIFLPSACGGGGTCAMCKCQVVKGGEVYYQRKQTFLVEKKYLKIID